jgi:hypothetical protein
MTPLHRPPPELPASRPVPLALDSPTETLTETAPEGLTPPVTFPPPADETRRPETVNGKLLELQLPARVLNCTFQMPSKAPGPAVLATRASAVTGAPAMAASTVAANTHRKARMGLKLTKEAVGRTDIVIFPCPV